MDKATDIIQFHYLVSDFRFTRRLNCKAFIQQLFRKEKQPLESISYIFCNDEYLLEINRTHLKHDYYTDIISFDLSAPGEPTTAEIYISIDRVKENARTHKEAFQRELHRVIFHGALHLCGYKDKSAKDAALMRKKEEECLKEYLDVPRETGRKVRGKI